MATISNDFLRFSAYSIKELITRKLSEDSNFTDQVYEGSNLAILIDIVSYMYQCLIYNLNTAASESMFADTQIYENISRLCKFIGYHPMAYKPSTVNAYLQNSTIVVDEDNQYPIIYPCTAIDTGLYDSRSNKIYFSTTFNKSSINDNGQIQIASGQGNTNMTLVNGKWKHYATVFTAAGLDYETFVLDGLKSSSSDEKYVANNGIQVFVIPNGIDIASIKSPNDIMWHNDPNELFVQAYNSSFVDPTFSVLYDNNDKVYTAYLNENKTFEIKFGNGITGKRLNAGDKVHVMYLDTNGPDGYIDISQMQQQLSGQIVLNGHVLEHNPGFFGLADDLYKAMFGIAADDQLNIANQQNIAVRFDPSSLSQPLPEQNTNDIREYAPTWFKTGNRLITKDDYEFLFKANNQSNLFSTVIDAVCMNNWDYMTTFYRWLYNIGINPVQEAKNAYQQIEKNNKTTILSPYRYLQKARLVQHGYEYVDSADANNIYLWIECKDRSGMAQIKEKINTSISTIKTMTSETYPLYPIDVYFDLTFTPSELYYQQLVSNKGNCAFDATNSYVEVTISDNSIFSNISIASKVESIIRNAFDVQHCVLGQIVDYSTILDEIYQINGVVRVRTIYYPKDYLENETMFEKYKTRACDGLAFASWSNTPLIEVGDDLQISNTTRTLEKFQFPSLAPGLNLASKIKVIRKSMNSINPVKF